MAEGVLYHVYCDESRQCQDRFMVFGGIIVRAASLEAFNQAVRLWREGHNMQAELKWTKVSPRKLAEYKSLVDLFFSLAGARTMYFKSVVFDTSEIDYHTYHQDDRELGFYKFFYQFLLHSFGLYLSGGPARALIFFDRRTTRYSLGAFCRILNNGLRKRYHLGQDVVRSVQAVESRLCDVIQLADVLMGAIGYQNNDCHLRSAANRAKVQLAEYIAAKANLLSLKQNTPRSMHHFGIWQFRFSQKKKAP